MIPAPALTSFLQAETWATITASLPETGLTPDTASGWYTPEIMRLEAISLLASGQTAAAEAKLLQALGLSRRSSLPT